MEASSAVAQPIRLSTSLSRPYRMDQLDPAEHREGGGRLLRPCASPERRPLLERHRATMESPPEKEPEPRSVLRKSRQRRESPFLASSHPIHYRLRNKWKVCTWFGHAHLLMLRSATNQPSSYDTSDDGLSRRVSRTCTN